MTLLEKYVAKWLQREGRVPDDALDRLPEEFAATVKNRVDLERIADKLVSASQDLAIRRRIVLYLRSRIEAQGALTPKEFEDLLVRARSVGWQTADVERLIENAKSAFAKRNRPPSNLELEKKQPEESPDAPPREPPRENSESRSERVPDSQMAGGSTEKSRTKPSGVPEFSPVATTGIVAVLVVILALLLLGRPWADKDDGPGSAGGSTTEAQVLSAQRLLGRLGEPVPETGRFDDATRAALDRALPQFAGMSELEPWLIEQLEAALDQADDEAWEAAQNRGTAAAIAAYLERFPDGLHAEDAQTQLSTTDAAEERSIIVRAIQQELDRLGRDVIETGELDLGTLNALEGFPGPMPNQTRASLAAALEQLEALRRWPVPNGETFQDCTVCPEMVAIPAGTFLMGSPEDEIMRIANEGPQREVSVPRFAMSRTEITHGQWFPCVNDGVCNSLPVPEQGDLRTMPVSHVTWDDALSYLRWLRERTGSNYRLPTEAQWEYAARAGTSTRYYTGECITDEQANFDARLTSGNCPEGIFYGGVLPVASYPPNPFGLYDMLGNLIEPTRDCWNSEYTGGPTDGSAWLTGDCGRAPMRGGSWRSTDRELRAAARIRPSGLRREASLGLRVVVDLPQRSGSP